MCCDYSEKDGGNDKYTVDYDEETQDVYNEVSRTYKVRLVDLFSRPSVRSWPLATRRQKSPNGLIARVAGLDTLIWKVGYSVPLLPESSVLISPVPKPLHFATLPRTTSSVHTLQFVRLETTNPQYTASERPRLPR